jgi:site-specific recombinase XerD
MATPTRKRRGRFSGRENDAGEALLTRLLTRQGATPRVVKLIYRSWAFDTFRKYRRTLTRMADYLKQRAKDELLLTKPQKAQWLIADFLAQSTETYSEAVVLQMGGHLRRITELFDARSEHAIARVAMRAIARQAPTKSRRYDTIWDLDQLLSWLEENWAANDTLPLQDLQTKALLLVMVFSACRLAELARMSRPDLTGGIPPSVTLRAVTKQRQAQLQDFVMRRASRPAICPVATLLAFLARTAEPRDGLLFHTEAGRALSRPVISYQFLKAFAAAGIDPHYTAYSVKHAVVTKLYNLGATDEQVCAYGHWAPGSRTPRQWYFIPVVDKEWLGTRIVSGFADSLRKAVLEGPAIEGGAAAPPPDQ